MARTIPPTRNTTGVTEVAFGGLSPIDAYSEDIDRPLGYFESTSAKVTSITAITNAYFKQTITAGCSHSIGGAAGHFQTHLAGALTGKIGGLGSWVELETGMTGYAQAMGAASVISPLNVGVRCRTGTVTLTDSMVVFGLEAQFIQSGSGTPTYLYFARLNSTSAITGLFYAASPESVGWITGTLSGVGAGHIPLVYVQGVGHNQVAYVNLYLS